MVKIHPVYLFNHNLQKLIPPKKNRAVGWHGGEAAAWGTQVLCRGNWVSVPALLPSPASCQCTPGEATGDGAAESLPPAVEKPGRAYRAWSGPGPALAVAGVWSVNQQIGVFSLHFSLSLCISK